MVTEYEADRYVKRRLVYELERNVVVTKAWLASLTTGDRKLVLEVTQKLLKELREM